MAIKHLTPRTSQELTNMEKFWERKEIWHSPFVIFLLIGYVIYYLYLYLVFFGIYWPIKWLIFSPIRPFSNSKFLCEQGFHKYRKISRYDDIVCIICNKHK